MLDLREQLRNLLCLYSPRLYKDESKSQNYTARLYTKTSLKGQSSARGSGHRWVLFLLCRGIVSLTPTHDTQVRGAPYCWARSQWDV